MTTCACSFCYLGQIKREMDRDLKFRITSMVISALHGAECEDGHLSLQHAIKADDIDRQFSGQGIIYPEHIEKSPELYQYDTEASTTNPHRIQNSFYDADWDDFVAASTQGLQVITNERQQAVPRPLSPWHLPTISTAGQDHGPNTGDMATRNGFSINSELMVYASPVRDQEFEAIRELQVDGDVHRREYNNFSTNAPSIALCSSTPLSHSSCSDYDDTCDRPIHPFDTGPHFRTTDELQAINRSAVSLGYSVGGILDMYIDPVDSIEARSRNGNHPSPAFQSQETLSAHHCHSGGLSRSQSQVTIEKWRIHVVPSPPAIPDLVVYTPKLEEDEEQGECRLEDYGDYTGDSCDPMPDDSISRRGTIPIILSSHIQQAEAAVDYQQDEELYYSADDFRITPPPNVFGQTRSQRQGSLNSTIGGYYSIASSPSLADSLSNPMYSEQSYEILSGSSYQGPSSARKGSLPTSIQGSSKEEAASKRAQQANLPTSQLYTLQNVAFPAPMTRVRARSPSHLSNLVSHGFEEGDTDGSNVAEDKASPSCLKKAHSRRHSQGAQSSGHDSDSSWDWHRAFNGPQSGCGAFANRPSTPSSSVEYQSPEEHVNVDFRISATPATDLKGVLAIDDPMQVNKRLWGEEPTYPSARLSDDEIVDQRVHPLDLSPLLPHSQSKDRHEYRGQTIEGTPPIFAHTTQDQNATFEEQVAWTETCIGLGLTLGPNADMDQTTSALTKESSTPLRPIPDKQPSNHATSYFRSNNIQDDLHEQPDTAISMAFGSTTTMTMTTMTTTTTTTTITGPTEAVQTNPCRQLIGCDNHDSCEKDTTRCRQRQHAAVPTQRLSLQEFNGIQRQPSQRNKKNLVVNIASLTSC
ncbi:hypothetical protein BGZ54_002439 [Gamsiella multidivaricata]|nr:hypothetical protein BGZ54_002439 [Gamsiella multidivaricata]